MVETSNINSNAVSQTQQSNSSQPVQNQQAQQTAQAVTTPQSVVDSVPQVQEGIEVSNRALDSDKAMLDYISSKTNIEPYISSYIGRNVKEKQEFISKIDDLTKKNKALEGQLGRYNDITLLAEYSFDAAEYEDIRRLCDYNITPDKLERLSKNTKYSFLLNKRSVQKQVSAGGEQTQGLFSEWIKKGSGGI